LKEILNKQSAALGHELQQIEIRNTIAPDISQAKEIVDIQRETLEKFPDELPLTIPDKIFDTNNAFLDFCNDNFLSNNPIGTNTGSTTVGFALSAYHDSSSFYQIISVENTNISSIVEEQERKHDIIQNEQDTSKKIVNLLMTLQPELTQSVIDVF